MRNINIYSNIESINEYLNSFYEKTREIPKKFKQMKKIELFILDYEKSDKSLINEILSYEENKYIMFNTSKVTENHKNIINIEEDIISLLDTIINIKNKDYLENFLKQLATGVKYYYEIDICETDASELIENYANISRSDMLSNKKNSLIIIENNKDDKEICESYLKYYIKNTYPYIDIIEIGKRNSFYINGNLNKLQMIIVEGNDDFNYKIYVDNECLYKKLNNKFRFGIDFVNESKANILIRQIDSSNYSYRDIKNNFEITMNEDNLIEFIEFLNDYNRGDIEIAFPSIDTIYSDLKNLKELTYVEKIVFDYSCDAYNTHLINLNEEFDDCECNEKIVPDYIYDPDPEHFTRSREILDNYEYKYAIKYHYDDDKRAWFDAMLDEAYESKKSNNVRCIGVQREGIYKEYEPMYKIFLFN